MDESKTHAGPWCLAEQVVRLRAGDIEAVLRPAEPARGLGDVRHGAAGIAGMNVLGLSFAARSPAQASHETLVRGRDVVAVYAESTGRPYRVDARWRLLDRRLWASCLAAVELVVSVRTPHPKARPQLAVQSEVPTTEVLRLMRDRRAAFRPLDGPATIDAAEGEGCLLFRLADHDVSYAEMVHPADDRRSTLTTPARRRASTLVRHSVFGEALEKGVILRARVCGLFLRRDGDREAAAAHYAIFTAAEPPLGN